MQTLSLTAATSLLFIGENLNLTVLNKKGRGFS